MLALAAVPDLAAERLNFPSVAAWDDLEGLGNFTDTIADDLHRRAPLPSARLLPIEGIAAQIGPGEVHVWELSDEIPDNARLTLSECIRQPSNAQALELAGGSFVGQSSDGGLLTVEDVSELNGTLVVTAPRNGSMWQYQIGAANASSYALDLPELYLVDSDFANALVVTSHYSKLAQDLNSTVYASTLYGNASALNVSDLGLLVFEGALNTNASLTPGLERSYCALQAAAVINQAGTDRSTTLRGATSKESRGQFLIKGLNISSHYTARLTLPPANNLSVGGAVYLPVPFRTKASTSCQLIYNMSFCEDMAFTVPGNASAFTTWELTEFYNNMAQERYANFSYALDQVQCNASRKDRYSVVSTCDDCADSYKQWLCAVTVPRCADWSNPAPFLKARNEGQSRNPAINMHIRPGRYKEILPCESLCFDLVKKCPTSLELQCPEKNMISQSYGKYSDDGDVTCSYPGAVYMEDGALFLRPSMGLLIIMIMAILI